MKLNKLSLAMILGLGALTMASCEGKLDLTNPNQQTTGTFGFNADDLEECVIAAYHDIRMEGSMARVGYTLDAVRGDEVWNTSQVWYLPFDDMDAPATDEISMCHGVNHTIPSMYATLSFLVQQAKTLTSARA